MTRPTDAALKHFAERAAPSEGFAIPGDPAIRYRLMSPEATEPGRKYPLVIFLHGAGERGDCNEAQLRYLPEVLATPENRKRYPCFVVAPQCPAERQWIEVSLRVVESVSLSTTGTAYRMMRAVLSDVLANQAIDVDRVYLTGISMGGYGCWYLAAWEAADFAAVAPICGGGDVRQGANLKATPIWAVHGADDEIVPVERSRQMVDAIRAAGGEPKYSELAGVGHHSWQPAYEPSFGLLDWMFEQRRK